MWRGLMGAVVVLGVGVSAWGQRAVAVDGRKADEVVKLWEGDPPGAIGTEDRDVPTLSVFRPEEGKANGAARAAQAASSHSSVSPLPANTR